MHLLCTWLEPSTQRGLVLFHSWHQHEVLQAACLCCGCTQGAAAGQSQALLVCSSQYTEPAFIWLPQNFSRHVPACHLTVGFCLHFVSGSPVVDTSSMQANDGGKHATS